MIRPKDVRPLVVSVLTAALAPACGGGDPRDTGDPSGGAGINLDQDDDDDDDTNEPPATEPPEVLEEMFAKAGEEFDVPVAILQSIALVETRWQMVQGAVE
ncbi:MAG: hypothetical protein R3A51_09120 [Nannocystaceae bacterium]